MREFIISTDSTNDLPEAYLKENNIEFIETTVGCTVAIHSGKKASGLFFISE